jgi:DNA polymerase-1
MKMGPPDTEALRELYSELGFTSLLRDLAPLTDHRKTDYLRLEMPGDTGKFLGTVKPGQETAAWLALDAQEADEEGFGTRVLGVELSTKIASARISENDAQDQALAALGDWLADPKKPKVVHDPKLFNLLAAKDIASDADGVAGIRHATMLYSYLLRPTTAKHEFAEVVLRHLNRTLSDAPGERWPAWKRPEFASTPPNSTESRPRRPKRSPGSKKAFLSWWDSNSTSARRSSWPKFYSTS